MATAIPYPFPLFFCFLGGQRGIQISNVAGGEGKKNLFMVKCVMSEIFLSFYLFFFCCCWIACSERKKAHVQATTWCSLWHAWALFPLR